MGLNLAVFGIDPNEDVGSGGYAARFYYNPSRSKFHVFHVGASWMQLWSDKDAQLRTRPESNTSNIRLVDTGLFPNINSGSTAGVEVAGARGSMTIRSEFFRSEWSKEQDVNRHFKGMYVEFSHFLTGEQANYREGKFIRPNIKSDNGAWEVALRFSSVDLNDKEIQGGSEKNLSFGINWYSRTHWRFMGNLIKVNSDGQYGKQDPWIAQVRVQYYF